MNNNGFVTAGQCKQCSKTPLIDLGLFLATKLVPIYLAGTVITGVLVVALAVVGLIQKIIEGFVKGYVIDRCLESAIRSHTPYLDTRMTVASATDSPTNSRVRKRRKVTPLSTFEPGGGSFGGAGAGSEWPADPVIDPLTGLPIDWHLGTSFQVTPTESGGALKMGTSISRPLAGYVQTNVDRNGNWLASQTRNPGALHEIGYLHFDGNRQRMNSNLLWIDGQSFGLMDNATSHPFPV